MIVLAECGISLYTRWMRTQTVQDLYKQFPDIDGFWSSEDLSVTEITIRQQLPQKPDSEWTAEEIGSLTQLARVQNLQEKSSEAKVTLEKAKTLLIMCPSDSSKIRTEIRLVLEEGRHLWLARNPAKAQNFFNQAWNMSTETKEDFFAVDAAIMLSLCQPRKSQNEWLQKALALAESSHDEQGKLWLTQLYVLNGWHCFDFRRFEEALENFNKALARPRGNGETSDLYMIRWCVGRALRGLNRVAEALDVQTQLKNDLSILGRVNGYVFLEIAECLQLLQRTEDAKSFYELAYKDLSMNPWFSDNNPTELRRMQFLFKLR